MDLQTYLKDLTLPSVKYLQQYFKSDESITIVEIGACEGEDSIRFSNLFPNAQIYSIEALPANFEIIKKNVAKFSLDNINPFNIAISDTNGKADFFVSSGNPEESVENDEWNYGNKSGSILEPKEVAKKYSWLKFEKKISVTTMTLDDFVKANGIEKINYLHVDVQGAEGKVIDGAKESLKLVDIAMLEVEESEFYSGQLLKDELEKKMFENGFEILERSISGETGDVIFRNKDYKVAE